MMSAQLTQIEDIPQLGRSSDHVSCRCWRCVGHIVGRDGAGGSVAFLLTRPGRNPMDDADRSWACGLTSAARQPWRCHVAGAFRERRRATCLRARRSCLWR